MSLASGHWMLQEPALRLFSGICIFKFRNVHFSSAEICTMILRLEFTDAGVGFRVHTFGLRVLDRMPPHLGLEEGNLAHTKHPPARWLPYGPRQSPIAGS